MTETITSVLSTINGYLWGWPMIILLLGTHVFLTIKLRVPQRRVFQGIKLSVTKDKNAQGDVTQFGALATALAATIGTGNIVGVATAIALGGPGAVLWCWLTGVFGIATKYSEAVLAIKYRVKTPDGKMIGGPMYALERGLGLKWLGIMFAFFAAIASFGIGSTVQANAISTLMKENLGINPYLCGAVISLLVTMVVVGGVKSISRVCEALVPFMALFYVAGCLYILVINADFIIPAIKWIVSEAFSLKSASGGFVGGGIMMAARFGIARGLFSNESGLGSAPIVAAAAKTRNPVRQALVSSTGTFWDTVVVCALTGIVIISSVLAHPDINLSDGALLTTMSFTKIPYVGKPLLTIGIFTFAFTTILGWCYYGERCVEYLKGKKWSYVFRGLYIVSVFLGSIINLNLVWTLADCTNALMAIPNLIALICLSGVILKETDYYLWENRLDELMENEVHGHVDHEGNEMK